jgi:hypothetical protein
MTEATSRARPDLDAGLAPGGHAVLADHGLGGLHHCFVRGS